MEGMDEEAQADLQVNTEEATSKNARKKELSNKHREEERKRKDEERARLVGTLQPQKPMQFFDGWYSAKFIALANGEHIDNVTICWGAAGVNQAKTVSKTPGFTWFPSKVESTSTAAATATSTSLL